MFLLHISFSKQMFVHLLSLQPHWALAEPQQGALPGGREGRPKGIQPFVGHRCTGGGGIFSVPILCLGCLSFDPLLRLPHAVPSHSLFQNHKSLLCFYKCRLHVQILRGCLEYVLSFVYANHDSFAPRVASQTRCTGWWSGSSPGSGRLVCRPCSGSACIACAAFSVTDHWVNGQLSCFWSSLDTYAFALLRIVAQDNVQATKNSAGRALKNDANCSTCPNLLVCRAVRARPQLQRRMANYGEPAGQHQHPGP